MMAGPLQPRIFSFVAQSVTPGIEGQDARIDLNLRWARVF
jgi:hypothetical protein